MVNRKLAVMTASIAVALTAFTGTAAAALLSDLTGLGYTVSAATQCENQSHVWVNVWYVSGYGLGTYLSECDPDFQATLDSIVTGHCERKWQYLQPAQFDAWRAIMQLGWTETADKCGDVFTVTNPNDLTVRYRGPGSGLVELALTIGAPPAPPPPAPPGVMPPPPPVVVVAAPTPEPTPTPEPPAPPAAAAPQPAPVAELPAVPAPAAVTPTRPVATPPSVTITLTPEQLRRIVKVAVAKALKRERARAKAAAARARASSHPKPRARRR